MCEKMIKNPYRRVWACVNLDALHDNLRQIAACRKNDAGIIAVIKADGYGHGAVMLTINAMTTADTVLVPIQCEYYALEGLSQLIHTVNLVRERLNPTLDIEGIVFTMYDARTNLSMQVVENVKDHLNQKVYKTMIPRNIRLAEAPSYGMPINLYDAKSAGAESYMALADEVIKRKGI